MPRRKKGCKPDSAPPITRSNPASAASNVITEAKSSTTATGSGVASTCTPLDYIALDQDHFSLQGQSSADPPLLSHAGAYFEDINVLLHSPFDCALGEYGCCALGEDGRLWYIDGGEKGEKRNIVLESRKSKTKFRFSREEQAPLCSTLPLHRFVTLRYTASTQYLNDINPCPFLTSTTTLL